MPEVEISLSNGGITRIDAADTTLLDGFMYFRRTSHGYVTMRQPKGPLVYVHRHIMAAGKGRVVDHINGDRLDNRRVNLRLCCTAENTWNSRPMSTNTSGCPGVWRARKKWHARIQIRGISVLLGNYESVEEATIAYEAARKVRDTVWPILREAA